MLPAGHQFHLTLVTDRQHRRCIIPQSSAPEDGRNYRPKHVELIEIINKICYCCIWLAVYTIVKKNLVGMNAITCLGFESLFDACNSSYDNLIQSHLSTSESPFGTFESPFRTSDSLFGTSDSLFCTSDSLFGTSDSLFCTYDSLFGTSD